MASKYGKLIERVKGSQGTVFVYSNKEGGYTVRFPREPVITISTLAAAQRVAREIAGRANLT